MSDMRGAAVASAEEETSAYERVYVEGGNELYSHPRHLQGAFPFAGAGLDCPCFLSETLTYQVPRGKRAQLIYFRAGNSTPELIYLILMRDDAPMRYFPIGARSSSHTALAVIEDILPGTVLQVYLAAPEGTSGTAVVDVGLLES